MQQRTAPSPPKTRYRWSDYRLDARVVSIRLNFRYRSHRSTSIPTLQMPLSERRMKGKEQSPDKALLTYIRGAGEAFNSKFRNTTNTFQMSQHRHLTTLRIMAASHNTIVIICPFTRRSKMAFRNSLAHTWYFTTRGNAPSSGLVFLWRSSVGFQGTLVDWRT